MYEKLVSDLRKGYTDRLKEAADAIEELQQTANHYKGCSDDWYREACDYKAMLPCWIPVSERLPEEHEWVLCKCRAKIREVLSLRDGYWYHDPQHQYMSGFVTHWMPLPEPPKEETPAEDTNVPRKPYDLLYEEGGYNSNGV